MKEGKLGTGEQVSKVPYARPKTTTNEETDRQMMPPPPPRPDGLSPVSVSGLNLGVLPMTRELAALKRLDKCSDRNTKYRKQWISAIHRTTAASAEVSAAASAVASAEASAGCSVSQPTAEQDKDYSQFVDIEREAQGEIISALAQEAQALAQETLASAQEAQAFNQLSEIKFYTRCLEFKVFTDLDELVRGYDSRAQPSESKQFIIAPPEYLDQLDSIIKLIGKGIEELAGICFGGQIYMKGIEDLYKCYKTVIDEAKCINAGMRPHLVERSISMPSQSAQPLSPG